MECSYAESYSVITWMMCTKWVKHITLMNVLFEDIHCESCVCLSDECSLDFSLFSDGVSVIAI